MTKFSYVFCTFFSAFPLSIEKLFLFYGLPTPKRKTVYKDFLKSEKKSKTVDWDFLDKCYEDEYREFQYLVMDYLTAMQKFLTYDDVSHIKNI